MMPSLGAPVHTVKTRGRPTAAQTAEDTQDEINSLRAEMREIAGEVIPLSAYLWRRAAIDGDSTAKLAAGRVVYLAKRLSERGGPPEAA